MSASVLRGVIAAIATAIDATGAPDHPSRRTANCNADLCARAWQKGDATALAQAMAVRGSFEGEPLVAGAKALRARYGPGPARPAIRHRPRGDPGRTSASAPPRWPESTPFPELTGSAGLSINPANEAAGFCRLSFSIS